MATISDNEISSFGFDTNESTTDPPEHELKPELNHRMLDCGGAAQLHLNETGIVMMNKSNGLSVDEYGTYIDGKTNLGRPPSDVRIGGFWIFNDKMLTGLPSTMYTPIPTLVYKEPDNLKYIQQFMQLISGI
jgi:hypothetical protein